MSYLHFRTIHGVTNKSGISWKDTTIDIKLAYKMLLSKELLFTKKENEHVQQNETHQTTSHLFSK